MSDSPPPDPPSSLVLEVSKSSNGGEVSSATEHIGDHGSSSSSLEDDVSEESDAEPEPPPPLGPMELGSTVLRRIFEQDRKAQGHTGLITPRTVASRTTELTTAESDGPDASESSSQLS